MVYLIGGVARSGKTRLAALILRRKGIPFISTDTLVDMIRGGAPELGLANWGQQKAEDFAPFFSRLVFHLRSTADPYVVEGNAFWPHHVRALDPDTPVRACFLGYSDATIETLSAVPSWVNQIDPDQRDRVMGELLADAAQIRNECDALGFRYFDVDPTNSASLDGAYEYLVDVAAPSA